MFRCDVCKQISKSKEKMTIIVKDKRDKTYYYLVIKKRRDIKKEYIEYKDKIELIKAKDELKSLGYDIIKDFETHGEEIVKEEHRCSKCITK